MNGRNAGPAIRTITIFPVEARRALAITRAVKVEAFGETLMLGKDGRVYSGRFRETRLVNALSNAKTWRALVQLGVVSAAQANAAIARGKVLDAASSKRLAAADIKRHAATLGLRLTKAQQDRLDAAGQGGEA